MEVEEYFDDTAAFYDAVYGESVDGDREFYRDLATDVDGPVLEIGCGTGRIYLELLRAGVDADGIDVSSGMLDVLRGKAAEDGLEPTVWEADVTEFEAGREYALVTVPFRAFLHLTEIDEQLEALERIHDSLASDGRLVLNAFAPSFEVICQQYGTWEKRHLEVDGASYTYRTKTEIIDEVEQLARVRAVVFDGDGDRLFQTDTPLALVSRREFELLFRLSPFASWRAFGGFDREPLEKASQEMVWIAE
ncbi:class I SAM-dependent DNA methyltransferase [Halostagnicola kamekurae]|uniref:Methyltransferase domain-containing protein n=1 Tax=Halostagnicola kamekurae TaxID=619731 RepID=A0A1I6SUC7_9EURY|nr:class I SAM-dependent methyltransferase [Halostagnicola kamekurae]SFS80480.1 Methyltransferase domain-containing protein [Halostagnicola kamekurae]